MGFSSEAYGSCRLCPRSCGAARSKGVAGFCGVDAVVRVARAALHFWEEPPISGEKGSGAIFFAGCPLRCVFCQNHAISQEGVGDEVTVARLAQIMLELEAQGAHNINLVTPMHYAPSVREAVLLAKDAGLRVPIVCNTSGYERPETIDGIADAVDVWLPDFKYASSDLARELSMAPDYPVRALRALERMLASLRERGGRLEDEDGILRRGIIVRHLVLPGHVDDSKGVLDLVWNLCGNEVDLSVMNQYTPNKACRAAGGSLARALASEEYEEVLDHADDLGFERLWWQQGGTVDESFIPAFDATGVVGPELK